MRCRRCSSSIRGCCPRSWAIRGGRGRRSIAWPRVVARRGPSTAPTPSSSTRCRTSRSSRPRSWPRSCVPQSPAATPRWTSPWRATRARRCAPRTSIGAPSPTSCILRWARRRPSTCWATCAARGSSRRSSSARGRSTSMLARRSVRGAAPSSRSRTPCRAAWCAAAFPTPRPSPAWGARCWSVRARCWSTPARGFPTCSGPTASTCGAATPPRASTSPSSRWSTARGASATSSRSARATAAPCTRCGPAPAPTSSAWR